MAKIEIKLKDAVKKSFTLPTGQKHQVRLIRPKVFVLDVEDSHFNFDRKVLLPDLSSTDGSVPVLDTRRVTGLGVIFAALVHAKKNTSQGLFVTGHTDASGTATYNQKLSEERAANVSLLLRGKRDDWRTLSAKDDAVDDVQTVLTWQSERAGWECDPEGIDNTPGPKTSQAIRGFQERYNLEVAKAQNAGLDSPFKKKITEDGRAGPETWGAFYDVYMTELMDLLDVDAFSALEQQQAQLKPAPGMVDFVGCGEHIPFNPARRSPFEASQEDGKDEHLEGPQKNPPDRRVEIMFFDPGEEVDLVCHPKPGQCKPDECEVYIKVPHRQIPIGIPKGLTIAEVNLRLTFVDPEGKVRPFPEGLPIQAKFGDPVDDVALPFSTRGEAPILDDRVDEADAAADSAAPAPTEEPPESMEVPQEPTATTGPNGVLQFVVPRKASSLFLRLLAGDERPFITADPNNLSDTKLASADELTEAVGQGRVFLQLPKQVNTQEAYFDLPTPAAGVTFKDGAFLNFDNKETQIGSRESPVELRLGIHWQHFKFEYFDRWTSSLTNVPQPRSKAAGGAAVPSLALEGASTLLETDVPVVRVAARSAWEVVSGKDTVHCLAWVRREVVKDQPRRDLPDAKCTARFVTSRLFVRTDGDGSAPDAPRTFVTFADNTIPNTPGVDRLRLYDLPGEWRSRVYPARLGGETPDKARAFEQVAGTLSTLGKPYVVSLDVLVLQADTGLGPDLKIQLDDSKLGNRFTIFDNQLRVFKPDPASGEPYFTRLADLTPKPTGPVFVDVPPFTRLFARGRFLFDVFDRRTGAFPAFKGAPIGARLAFRLPDTKPTTAVSLPMTPTAAPFEAARANSTNSGPVPIGDARTALLRCCGHDKNVELFNVIQYVSVAFDFARKLTKDVLDAFPILKGAVALSKPPPNASTQARDCLLKIADRWNGKDDLNTAPGTFEIGTPATARGQYVAFLTQGDPKPPPKPGAALPIGEVRISMIASGRSFMSGSSAEGFWDLERLAPGDEGRFTAAHETGHIYSQPDEYLNTDDEPSYGQPNIGEDFRSAGAPYGLDRRAMMVNNFEVRARYFWDMLLFAREKGHFSDAKALFVKHGPMTFTTDVTPLKQSRVRFPVGQQVNVSIPPFGLCDLFVYVTGHDEFTSGLDDSAAASPYDGFVVVRVKMAWTVPNTSEFDEIDKFMDRAIKSIRSTFNLKTRLAIRARFGGKAVRLRVLFAPRLVCGTFPTGSGAAKYLRSIGDPPLPTPFKKEDYEKHTTDVIKNRGVHVNVRIGTGTIGVSGSSIPREAVVRDDKTILLIFSDSRFDDDVAAMFGQMVGVPFTRSGTVADYRGLLDALPSDLTNVVPEIVP